MRMDMGYPARRSAAMIDHRREAAKQLAAQRRTAQPERVIKTRTVDGTCDLLVQMFREHPSARAVLVLKRDDMIFFRENIGSVRDALLKRRLQIKPKYGKFSRFPRRAKDITAIEMWQV